MIDTIKRLVLFRIKSLEFKYKTWQNKREIANAYDGEKPPVVKRLRPAIPVRRIASVVSIILLLCLAGYALYAVGNYVKGIQFPVPSMETLLDDDSSEKAKTVVHETASKQSADETAQDLLEKKPQTMQNTGLNREQDPGEITSLDTIPEMVLLSETQIPPSADYTFEFGDSMNCVILANKADRKMHILYRQDTTWSVMHSFRMAVGAVDGAKESDGDRRTPEGLYFIVGRKEGRELNEIYGPLAYVLNYPNAEDRRKGRTGQGIWIHGTAPDSTPIQTRGCLELDNENLVRLSDLLHIGIGTPVFIVDRDDIEQPAHFPSYVKIAQRRRKILDQYNRNQNFFASVVIDWQKAWESQQIDMYEKFYDHDRFFGQGLAWDGWKGRKIRTFIAYDTIRVSCKDILLTDFSESTAVVKFVQRYESDLLQVENGKKLSLIKSGEDWKIIGESTFPKEELLL